MSYKKPRLLYWEEAYDAWFPVWGEAVEELASILDWPASYIDGEEFALRLKRMDLTDEELEAIPEV